MGNRPSQATTYPVDEEELRHAPHNFYLIFGKPSINYARGTVRGPLIYDVDAEYDEENDAVEHTATLDLSCAVPRRQKFDLIAFPRQTPLTSASASNPRQDNRGLALTFRVASTSPARRVRVLTNVSLEYRPGDGIHLASSDAATAAPSCIFSTTSTANLDVVVTRADIVPQQLRPVTYETAPRPAGRTSAQRVTHAPIVIEVEIEETASLLQNRGKQPATTTTTTGEKVDAKASEHATQPPLQLSPPSPAAASAVPSTPSPSHRRRITQYTLLEVPPAAADALAAPAKREEGTTPVRVTCTVCKQLLQIGSEVYDLEDVFDMGHEDELQNPQAETDEDVCVVCLTNPRNTTVLPCRHMCLCNECATQLRLSDNRCPLCRGNIDRLMTF